MSTKYYLFDGSFGGFLSAVFQSFYRKEWVIVPCTIDELSFSIVFDFVEIEKDREHSERVWNGLKKRLNSEECLDLYRVFLSEDRKAWAILFRLIQRVFKEEGFSFKNFGDLDVLYFAQVLKKVHRERHRMKAFIRFKKSEDDLYVCIVEPDFNVLPLIVQFFKNRYADQKWLIYDVKRDYGYLYDMQSVIEVYKMESEHQTTPAVSIDLAQDEELYQLLWKRYFKSTNIEARKNMKLHLRHVPKRYWKYLTEKN